MQQVLESWLLINKNWNLIFYNTCLSLQSEGSGNWEADPWKQRQNPQVSCHHGIIKHHLLRIRFISQHYIKYNISSTLISNWMCFPYPGARLCWWLATALLPWRLWWVDAHSHAAIKIKALMLMIRLPHRQLSRAGRVFHSLQSPLQARAMCEIKRLSLVWHDLRGESKVGNRNQVTQSSFNLF